MEENLSFKVEKSSNTFFRPAGLQCIGWERKLFLTSLCITAKRERCGVETHMHVTSLCSHRKHFTIPLIIPLLIKEIPTDGITVHCLLELEKLILKFVRSLLKKIQEKKLWKRNYGKEGQLVLRINGSCSY